MTHAHPASAATGAMAQPAAEQIARAAFFGNPSRTAATISPDGAHIAFLAPLDGVLNVWVAPVGAISEAKVLSRETERPIGAFFWAPDSSRVLYLQDQGGAEDYLLYGVALGGGRTVGLTPFAKTTARIVGVSRHVHDAILIGLNNRDARWHDVWRLDPESGALTLVWENPGGYAAVFADRELNLVLAQRSLADGGSQFERFDEGLRLTTLFSIDLEDSLSTGVISVRDRACIYLIDSRGRDAAALCRMDAGSGETKVIAQDARADIGGSIRDPRTGDVEAYSVNYLTRRWTGLTPEAASDISLVNRLAGGEWLVTSQSDDDRLWTVLVDRVSEPASFHLFDRQTKAFTKLFTTRPELEGKTLAAMQPLEVRARDGLTLVCYLSLPPGAHGSGAEGDGRPQRPLPMVLLVHGGPWGRDVYGYNAYHQWLANRGYAVLSVNFRGSTGFGKSFITAGDRQWGAAMHDDLLDAADEAVKRGITTPGAIAIMGGSYGGYAVLAGLTMTPEVFACGVDIVGPSNLITLLETIPPYWAAIYEQFAQRMGDPRTPEGRALLVERSPLTHADKISAPLLIGQGANDPRVNKRESDQIVEAMKARGIPVTYVNYPDEGHGFHRPENNISFNAIIEGFLARCLGGANEPIGGDFAGASLEVLEGAQHVEGLTAALAGRNGPTAAAGAGRL
ncbi:MAG TPA: S9 family peptidase [Caulobacteraceae bacterium]